MSSPWIEGIPPRAERVAPRIDVLTPTYFHPVFATLLSNRVWTRWKHYDTETKRPFPCSASVTCGSCLAGLIKYPTGFVCCCSDRSYRLVILQLSDLALADLENYAEKAPLVRGLKLKTVRQDSRKNAKMHAHILGRDEREDLPDPFDPRPTLERMWGAADTRLMTSNDVRGQDAAKKSKRSGRGR